MRWILTSFSSVQAQLLTPSRSIGQFDERLLADIGLDRDGNLLNDEDRTAGAMRIRVAQPTRFIDQCRRLVLATAGSLLHDLDRFADADAPELTAEDEAFLREHSRGL